MGEGGFFFCCYCGCLWWCFVVDGFVWGVGGLVCDDCVVLGELG